MKEIGILFSAPMVRALLDGSKTQTRRVMIPQPPAWCKEFGFTAFTPPGHISGRGIYEGEPAEKFFKLPYVAGDRLWVRETWAEVGTMDPGLIVYRADYPAYVPWQYENVPPAEKITWKPSIHMFKKYSRILLEVTAVRVERLKDISEVDAIAEGIERYQNCYRIGRPHPTDGVRKYYADPLLAFRDLWKSVNGSNSWKANPVVRITEFKRITQ